MKPKTDFINTDTKKSLIQMFIPLCLAMILTMVYSLVDGLWVGNMLGESGMSALTAGTSIVLIMNSLSMGMGNGISVMIAQMVGAKKFERIPGAAATIFFVSLLLSFVGFLILEALVHPLMMLLGTPEEILSDASSYLAIYLIGNVALFLYMQFTSIFRAFGDSLFQMKGMLMTVIFNATADPFMIKAWGLDGAAVATVISEVLCLLYSVYYYKKKQLFSLDFKSMKLNYAKTMFSLSIPTTIQAVMPALSSAAMISLITTFGVDAIAGYGVARNLELIMFMPTTAMCMAVTSIVGQCKGAQRMDRAGDYLKASMVFGGIMIAVVSAAVILFSGSLTDLFGQGPAAAAIVSQFFYVISIGYVLYMLTSCLQGYITGIGKPGLAMILLIIYYLIIRVPAAVLLKSCLGLNGIWLAFLFSHIGAFLVALIMILLSKLIDRKVSI